MAFNRGFVTNVCAMCKLKTMLNSKYHININDFIIQGNFQTAINLYIYI